LHIFYNSLVEKYGKNIDVIAKDSMDKFIKTFPDLENHKNIFKYNTGKNYSTKDKIAFEHPAIYPEKLAQDHIMTWSNENDIILDPMCGSGTTLKMAKILKRRWIGIDISQEYCDITIKRLSNTTVPIF